MSPAKHLFISLIALIIATPCLAVVQTGLDNINAHKSLFENQRIGIVANHTACDAQGKFIVDIFREIPGVTVTALFGPEHGFEGAHRAGEKVESSLDSKNNIPIYSLYGKNRKPTPEMLQNIDILVFDIQDIGTRYYTYIYTMLQAMTAAAENNKPFIVLDRPNPINAVSVQGNVMIESLSSSVGLYPLAVRHGMTAGELARLYNSDELRKEKPRAQLTVIPMTGYHREFWYDETGLKFIKPSPNMTTVETATIYPGTCLLEGTNLSEGRGTDLPFLLFGAPWLDSQQLTEKLNALQIPGLKFQPAQFTPESSKQAQTLCSGSKIIITDRDKLDAFWAGIYIVKTIYQADKDNFQWKKGHFDRLSGTEKIRNAIIEDTPLEPIKEESEKALEEFRQLRQKYLIY